MPRSLPADIAEYSSIAPRLVEAGFTVLAIDPRSGDGAFGGTHRTVAGPGQSTAYEQAEAALAWARFDRLLPTMLELRPTCEHCATRSRLTPFIFGMLAGGDASDANSLPRRRARTGAAGPSLKS